MARHSLIDWAMMSGARTKPAHRPTVKPRTGKVYLPKHAAVTGQHGQVNKGRSFFGRGV